MNGRRFDRGLNLQEALLRGWRPYADAAARVFRTTVLLIARGEKVGRSRIGQAPSPPVDGYRVIWASDDGGGEKETRHILEFWPRDGSIIYTDSETKGVFKATHVSKVASAYEDTHLHIYSKQGDTTSEMLINAHGLKQLIYRHDRQCGTSSAIIIDIQTQRAICICHSGDVLELNNIAGFAHKGDMLILKTDDGRTYCEYTVSVDKLERALVSPFGGVLAKSIYTACFEKALVDIQLRKHMENHHRS